MIGATAKKNPPLLHHGNRAGGSWQAEKKPVCTANLHQWLNSQTLHVLTVLRSAWRRSGSMTLLEHDALTVSRLFTSSEILKNCRAVWWDSCLKFSILEHFCLWKKSAQVVSKWMHLYFSHLNLTKNNFYVRAYQSHLSITEVMERDISSETKLNPRNNKLQHKLILR